VNLLLLDNCEEYGKTYGVDGRPLEHCTISAAVQRRAAKYKAAIEREPEQAMKKETNSSLASKDLWQCAYAEGGQGAADCWQKVGMKRTPIGTFFGLCNPALPRAKEIVGKVPNMRSISLTEVCPSNQLSHPSQRWIH
jgi:hypothetical protein